MNSFKLLETIDKRANMIFTTDDLAMIWCGVKTNF